MVPWACESFYRYYDRSASTARWSSLYEPMAIAIISGLLFATVLTLGVVLILYSLFFSVSFKEFVY